MPERIKVESHLTIEDPQKEGPEQSGPRQGHCGKVTPKGDQQSRVRALLYTMHIPLRKLLLVRGYGTQRGTPHTSTQGCSAQLLGEHFADRLWPLAQSGEKACREQEPESAQEGVPSAPPAPMEPLGLALCSPFTDHLW